MRRWWAWMAPALLFFGIVAAVMTRALQLCHGHFGYPMDDTYIHMAIAKNFVLHGVWGVTRYAFSSSTSSPLYTLLLAACYRTTGIHEVTPLVLNLAAALGLLAFANHLLRRAGWGSGVTLITLSAMVLLMPLPALAEGGMEHVCHTVLTLIFLHLACLALVRYEANQPRIWLITVGPVLVMTRYEGLFLVLMAGLLLALQKRWGSSFALVSIASIPLAIYGMVSVRLGWLPLPNSILLKANVPHGSTHLPALRFLWNWALAGWQAPHVSLLLATALALLYFRWKRDGSIWNYGSLGLVQFAGICSLHLELARTGWFYRYEAYLVAAGILTIVIAMRDVRLWQRSWALRAATVCAALAVGTLGFKSYRSVVYGPRAFHNIYEQQYQMALFVNQYYPRATIVLNDIGAVCFFTDAKVLDVYGLGNMEPARAKLRNGYNTEWLRKWAADEHASLAMLYASGWAGESFQIPREWNRITDWTLSDNFVLAGDTVEILAVDPSASTQLTNDLERFRGKLPGEIRYSRPQ